MLARPLPLLLVAGVAASATTQDTAAPAATTTVNGERVELPHARMLVPDGYTVPPHGRVPLFVHFQGAVAAAEQNFARIARPGVLVASTLAGRSGAFAEPYRDPAAFAELLAAGERALAAHAGRAVRFTPITITFWSAGYGAVRELLADPGHFARIDSLVSADSIYASVVAPNVRAPNAEQMVDFARFAQAAARGDKTFVVLHGTYQTDYASTAETAAYLCASVAAEPRPGSGPLARGGAPAGGRSRIEVAREWHVGGFHCYAVDEATAAIHVDCLYAVPDLVRRHVPPAADVRLVCWNIRHGRGRDDRVDPARVAAELGALAPDLVCLQEVDRGVERSGRVDLAGEIARALGWHAAFGKNIDYQGGDYGNAILSRWAIERHANHHYRMLRTGEQRGALWAEVTTERGAFAFATTHLEANTADDERRAQVPEILGLCEEHALAFVAGDFNDFPDRPVHDALTAVLDDAWEDAGSGPGATYPSRSPERRIDWVLVRRTGSLRPVSARVVETDASDHCALVVDFVWR